MALVGATVVEIVPDRVWRVFGGVMDAGATGHIVLTDKGTLPAGAVVLKAGDNTFYRDPGGTALENTTQVAIEGMAAPGVHAVSVSKTGSATNPRLVILLTNEDGTNATPPLDIYVTVH